MNYAMLLSFSLATLALALSPGPDNIYVLIQSITNGKKYGLLTVVGLILGCLVHTALVALGVSALLANNEQLFFIVKLFGAFYMLYLAYRVYTSDTNLAFAEISASKKTNLQLIQQGFLMNVLNPKVSLFFLALFPTFLFSEKWPTSLQIFVLGLLFMVLSFVVFSTLAIAAGSIAKYLKNSEKAVVYLKYLQVVVFIAIAVFIIL